MAEDRMIISNNIVKKNKLLKANQKRVKKSEINKRLFDPRPKIYKLTRLTDEELIDLTGKNALHEYDESLIPTDAGKIMKIIKECRIEGLSGGCFPADKKLESIQQYSGNNRCFVVNGIECDPGLLHDEWLLEHEWKLIQLGIKAICRLCSFDKVIVASRHSYSHSFDTEGGKYPEVKLMQFDYQYPLGEEHVLIKRALGIKLEADEIPAEQGILISNIQTVLAVGQAVVTGKKQDNRYLTACDLTTGDTRVVRAPFGMNAELVLDKVFTHIPEGCESYAGSGVMNSHKLGRDENVLASTNILAYARPFAYAEITSCGGCGRCAKKCPAGVQVNAVIKCLRQGKSVPKEMTAACMRCNSCTYYCRAGIDLMTHVNSI